MKLVKYKVDDLVVDYRAISEQLNIICTQRAVKWRITGMAQRGEDVLFMMDKERDGIYHSYLIREIRNESLGELEEEILSHHQSNMYTVGLIEINETETYALYSRFAD